MENKKSKMEMEMNYCFIIDQSGSMKVYRNLLKKFYTNIVSSQIPTGNIHVIGFGDETTIGGAKIFEGEPVTDGSSTLAKNIPGHLKYVMSNRNNMVWCIVIISDGKLHDYENFRCEFEKNIECESSLQYHPVYISCGQKAALAQLNIMDKKNYGLSMYYMLEDALGENFTSNLLSLAMKEYKCVDGEFINVSSHGQQTRVIKEYPLLKVNSLTWLNDVESEHLYKYILRVNALTKEDNMRRKKYELLRWLIRSPLSTNRTRLIRELQLLTVFDTNNSQSYVENMNRRITFDDGEDEEMGGMFTSSRDCPKFLINWTRDAGARIYYRIVCYKDKYCREPIESCQDGNTLYIYNDINIVYYTIEICSERDRDVCLSLRIDGNDVVQSTVKYGCGIVAGTSNNKRFILVASKSLREDDTLIGGTSIELQFNENEEDDRSETQTDCIGGGDDEVDGGDEEVDCGDDAVMSSMTRALATTCTSNNVFKFKVDNVGRAPKFGSHFTTIKVYFVAESIRRVRKILFSEPNAVFETTNLCASCLVNVPQFKFNNCKHNVLCAQCIAEYNGAQRCPVCRTEGNIVKKTLDKYLVDKYLVDLQV